MNSLVRYYTPEYTPIVSQIPSKLFLEQNPQLTVNIKSTVCEVCLIDDPIFLLKCDMCGILIHNYCYDIQVFQDPWICQGCIWTLFNTQNFSCRVCKNFQGALRKDFHGWVHSVCKKWLKTPDQGAETCNYCKVTDNWWVKCNECDNKYHPYCGYLSGMKKFDQAFKCAVHSGVEFKPEEELPKFLIKENLDEQTLIIDTIVPQSQLGKPCKKPKNRKNRPRKIKDNKSKKNSIESNQETNALDDVDMGGPDLYCFQPTIQKLTKINSKCGKVELSNKLEHYLFLNSGIKASCYELPSDLIGAFGRKKFFYYEFPDIVLNYVMPISNP